MKSTAPFMEVVDMIVENGGQALDDCYQCGTCSSVCPWGDFRDFRLRNLIRLAQFGIEGYEGEDLWNCTTCGMCLERCPRGVKTIDIVRSIRNIMGEAGTLPPLLQSALSGLAGNGNPWAGDPDKRSAWASEVGLRPHTEESEILLYTCCTHAYDPRNLKAQRTLVRLLEKAGVKWGSLGNDEKCCGDPAHKGGRKDVYESLRDENTQQIRGLAPKKIVVTSPHCLENFKENYEGLKGVTVIHVAELLRDLIRDGRLKPEKPVKARVAYHDPCYLGRHNGIYDAPREVLKAIPGVELVELSRHHEDSLCCGGGGGRMWSDTPVAERFSVQRINDACAQGAQSLATACPYCVLMLTDSLGTVGKQDSLEVVDLGELLARSIDMGTLEGSPNPPAMVRGEQSSPAPHATGGGR